MPRISCLKSVAIVRTPRVKQLEGMFDVQPSECSEMRWEVALPLEERDWQIGLVVGPSGCGKTTIARELFGEAMVSGFDWPHDKSIVDAFPSSMGIKDVVGLLSSVGFSSPPSWLRPFRVLSNGEQFRVTIARALAEQPALAVIDEFTSVVDRTVARIGSAAIARTIRRSKKRLVAVSCHYDIIDWLAPDWIYDPSANEFQWRCLSARVERPAGPERRGPCRPPVCLEIARVHRAAWQIFKQHHYLSRELNKSARCFVAFVVDGAEACSGRPDATPTVRAALRPAAFTAVLHAPDALGGYWREHRTVCLPDFQGVGIGNALSEFVAALFVAPDSQGRIKRYCSRTSHPAMIRHRANSPLWTMLGGLSFSRKHTSQYAAFNRSAALHRLTAGFRFVGQPNVKAARDLGIISSGSGP